MIRHSITPARLRKLILEHDKPKNRTWFAEAAATLSTLPDPPKRDDFKPLWKRIKQVYIDLQGSKCCFCEKPLEGKIDQDVEHFRPKTELRPWKVPKVLVNAGVKVRQPPPKGLGYSRLAYHPLNYAMACKVCNSVLKKNYFPIANRYRLHGVNPVKMGIEEAYLIYPIGTHDSDPEEMIEFEGLSPRPKAPSGPGRLRAMVTIELFKLDNPNTRRSLFKLRAYLIRLLFLELRGLAEAKSAIDQARHNRAIAILTHWKSPFTNCMRSFRRLYDNPATRSRAEACADECLKYFKFKSIGQTLS